MRAKQTNNNYKQLYYKNKIIVKFNSPSIIYNLFSNIKTNSKHSFFKIIKSKHVTFFIRVY